MSVIRMSSPEEMRARRTPGTTPTRFGPVQHQGDVVDARCASRSHVRMLSTIRDADRTSESTYRVGAFVGAFSRNDDQDSKPSRWPHGSGFDLPNSFHPSGQGGTRARRYSESTNTTLSGCAPL